MMKNVVSAITNKKCDGYTCKHALIIVSLIVRGTFIDSNESFPSKESQGFLGT